MSKNLDHTWIWEENLRLTKLQAWIDLTYLAQKDLTVEISQRECAERWNWSRGAVRNFWDQLIKTGYVTAVLIEKNPPSKPSSKPTPQAHHKTVFRLCKPKDYKNPTLPVSPPSKPSSKPTPQAHPKNGETVEQIDFDQLLNFINKKTGINRRIINNSVRLKYSALLKQGYTKKMINIAVEAAVKTKNHIESGFKFLTPEFFSRPSTIDKYGFGDTTKNSNKQAVPIQKGSFSR